MDQTDNIFALLDLIPAPGFCVRDGLICHINPAAAFLPLQTGDPIRPILHTGMQEYNDFQEGILNLTLSIRSQLTEASVIAIDGVHLFLLAQETYQTQLQSLALAAQHLRQPLSGILTGIENLQSCHPSESPEERDCSAKLNLNLHQLLRMVCNMSDAYLYTQKPLVRMEIRNIPHLFEELLEKAAALIEKTGIHLRYSGISEPVYGLVDADKLERAVENLLSNAVKYSSPGDTVNVRLARRDGLLLLTVEDQGDGVGEDIRKNLYSRYLRQPGLGDIRDGIGLGITLVRSIAALHGGTLMAQPAKGRGSRFTMTIAIRDHADAQLQSPMLHIDYTGGRDPVLLELSEVLPWQLYE